MDIFLNALYLTGGLVLLYFGGHYLVKGASKIALTLKVSPLVVGLTIVAFGTSAPELFVSVASALAGNADISLGNIVGSNIINIVLILGIASVLHPMASNKRLTRVDMPILFGVYLLVLVFALNLESITSTPFTGGIVTRWEGLALIAALVTYVIFLYRSATHDDPEALEVVDLGEVEEAQHDHSPLWLSLIMVAGGVAALAFGSEFLIKGASYFARTFLGASDRFIGITIVAFGTSLPELVTSLVAAFKKEMDISLGNIIGSNLFNCLMVLGATGLIKDLQLGQTSYMWDFILMIFVTLLLFAFLRFGKKLNRLMGLSFLVIYGGYLFYMIQTRTI